MNGTLGKVLTVAGQYVEACQIPATGVLFATVSLFILNPGVNDAVVRISSGEQTAPDEVDHIEKGGIVPSGGGTLERTCIPISPGERIQIWSDQPGVILRVAGLTQQA